MAKIVARNDPCPCESGKKFKQCCMGKKQLRGQTRWRIYVGLALIGVAAIVAVSLLQGFQTGLIAGAGYLLGIGLVLVLRKPPPPAGSNKDPAGLSFGR